jgi:uncharacterized protein YbaA (DUF1428 family)
MTYVDGFVAAVPTTNREIYKKHAETAGLVFKEHGALKFVECWGDDVPDGKLPSFPMAVKRKDDETLFLDHLAVARSEKRGHEESHGRSSHATGCKPHAL